LAIKSVSKKLVCGQAFLTFPELWSLIWIHSEKKRSKTVATLTLSLAARAGKKLPIT
jgi:hypothetical protein